MTPAARLVGHLRDLWPGWGILSPLPFVAWPVYCLVRGEARWELLVVLVVVPLLAFTSQASKKLFVGLYPIGLVGLFYDAMRFFKGVGLTPGRVHLCDLRSVDLSLFGVTEGGTRETLQDWFQRHHTAFLDAWCSVPYGTFIFVSIAFAAFLYRKKLGALERYGWCFLALNIAGFATHHLYPAAPPWYYHAHGCVVDLATRASEGPGLARVDAALGVRYFGGLYGRSNDVFGAMPSLHIAYPLLIALEGWRHFGARLRAAIVIYTATMAFAAVYLDHHWVVDVLAGMAYCLVAQAGVRRVFSRLVPVKPDSAGPGPTGDAPPLAESVAGG